MTVPQVDPKGSATHVLTYALTQKELGNKHDNWLLCHVICAIIMAFSQSTDYEVTML